MIDLFSGIGGFSIAGHWAGFQTIAFSEIDPFCCRVIAHHFPGIPNLGDIRTADFSVYGDRVDLITGGVPCQPASVAGKRKSSNDARWLWPDFLAVVRAVRPRWIVAENVPGIVGLKPHGLDWILSELEDSGYQCLPILMGADDVGAPHRRKRMWIVGRRMANPESKGLASFTRPSDNGRQRIQDGRSTSLSASGESPGMDLSPRGQDHERGTGSMAAAQGCRESSNAAARDAGEVLGDSQCGRRAGVSRRRSGQITSDGRSWIAQSRLGLATHDVPGRLARYPARPGEAQNEWEAPRVAKGVKERSAKLKALGNSIVPECAFHILKAIAALGAAE